MFEGTKSKIIDNSNTSEADIDQKTRLVCLFLPDNDLYALIIDRLTTPQTLELAQIRSSAALITNEIRITFFWCLNLTRRERKSFDIFPSVLTRSSMNVKQETSAITFSFQINYLLCFYHLWHKKFMNLKYLRRVLKFIDSTASRSFETQKKTALKWFFFIFHMIIFCFSSFFRRGETVCDVT